MELAAEGGGGVCEGGKGFENGRVEAFFLGRDGGGGKWIRREATVTAAKVDVGAEENDDDYKYEEKDDRAHHDLGVAGVLYFKVWFSSHKNEREKREEATE